MHYRSDPMGADGTTRVIHDVLDTAHRVRNIIQKVQDGIGL